MRITYLEPATRRAALTALILVGGLALTQRAHATQQRDFLVGPVSLGPGDVLMVSVANVAAAPRCLEPARVAFVEHELGAPSPSSERGAIAVDDIARTELGAARLASGKSASMQVRGGSRLTTKTVQVRVESERPMLGVDPCINIGGSVLRSNGRTEAIAHVQFADDFSILRPNSELHCFGHSECEELLSFCEQTPDCSFTCHIANPNPDEQACIWGSTD